MKIMLLFLALALASCSPYISKVGKKCIGNEQGGQSWSYLWFVYEDVEFEKCEEK